MKKVNLREVQLEDIHGNPMPGDFHEVLGNQLYMQGRDIKECELGRKIYFAEGEIELTDDEARSSARPSKDGVTWREPPSKRCLTHKFSS